MKYILGLDGGGTKTTLAAAMQGREVFRIQGGAINLNGASFKAVEKNLSALLIEAAEKMGEAECAGMCIAAAGISNPAVAPALEGIAANCFPAAHIKITSDYTAALSGAHEGQGGLLLIAGTGSVCCGQNSSGQSLRSGGLGHIMDDFGSGYDIGRQILQAVACAHDGRRPKTVLTSLVYNKLNISDISELVEYVYKPGNGKDLIAAFSSILPEAAKQKDEAAFEIVRNAALALVDMVVPVASGLGLQGGTLALAGSVLQKDEFICPAFEKKLEETLPHMNCILPKKDAAAGSLIIAEKMLAE